MQNGEVGEANQGAEWTRKVMSVYSVVVEGNSDMRKRREKKGIDGGLRHFLSPGEFGCAVRVDPASQSARPHGGLVGPWITGCDSQLKTPPRLARSVDLQCTSILRDNACFVQVTPSHSNLFGFALKAIDQPHSRPWPGGL